jgi:hypothetical protein
MKIDGFVKSPIFMSFRAKREILWEQAIEKIGFLPTVEMTNADFSTFYEFIKIGPLIKAHTLSYRCSDDLGGHFGP